MCMLSRSAQLCPTLCDPMDCSLPDSCVHGILQARILEPVAISFSGDLPDLGMEPESPASPALAGRFFTTSATWEALRIDGFLLAHQYTRWSRNASQGAGQEAAEEVWDAQDPS